MKSTNDFLAGLLSNSYMDSRLEVQIRVLTASQFYIFLIRYMFLWRIILMRVAEEKGEIESAIQEFLLAFMSTLPILRPGQSTIRICFPIVLIQSRQLPVSNE